MRQGDPSIDWARVYKVCHAPAAPRTPATRVLAKVHSQNKKQPSFQQLSSPRSPFLDAVEPPNLEFEVRLLDSIAEIDCVPVAPTQTETKLAEMQRELGELKRKITELEGHNGELEERVDQLEGQQMAHLGKRPRGASGKAPRQRC